MSQRMPSHCSAISAMVSITACRSPGWKALSWSTSGHAGKYGSRPQANTFPPTATNDAGSLPRIVGVSLNEVFGMIADPGMIRRHVVGHEIEDEPQAALARACYARRRVPAARRGVRRRRSGARSRASRHCPPPTKSGRARRKSSRSPGLRMEIAIPAGLRSQTPMNQTASKPPEAMHPTPPPAPCRGSAASGISG